eukprot:TRINITY_DN6225_c0_g1_i1.p1 TRINITY_DN6225_c0_g1~~TRINITY_DN6225_c0_g1_i1.p1  ORF type:complete len:221 (+),score=59.80 TRINITY_DN6225_c0_g1_i1:181-843(+)
MKNLLLVSILALFAICIADRGVATYFSGDDTNLSYLVCMPGNGHHNPNPASNGKPTFNYGAMSTSSPYWRAHGWGQCNGGKSPFGGPTTNADCERYKNSGYSNPPGPSCEAARRSSSSGDVCDKCFGVRCVGAANPGGNPCKAGKTTYIRIYDVCPSNHPNNVCKARMGWNGGNPSNSCLNTTLNAIDLYKGAFNEIADTSRGFIQIEFFPAACSKVPRI